VKIPEETVGAKIRNKLVFPSTVLQQLLRKGRPVSKENIKEALEVLEEIVELTKNEKGGA